MCWAVELVAMRDAVLTVSPNSRKRPTPGTLASSSMAEGSIARRADDDDDEEEEEAPSPSGVTSSSPSSSVHDQPNPCFVVKTYTLIVLDFTSLHFSLSHIHIYTYIHTYIHTYIQTNMVAFVSLQMKSCS